MHLLRIAERVNQHEVDDRLQSGRRIVIVFVVTWGLRHTGTDHDGAEHTVGPDACLVRIHGRDAHHGRRPQPYGIVTAGDFLCDLDCIIERELLDHPGGSRFADQMDIETAHLHRAIAAAGWCSGAVIVRMAAGIDGICPLTIERDGAVTEVIVLRELAG